LPEKHFDGVFGNAALFHAPSKDLPSVLLELHATPKPRRRNLGLAPAMSAVGGRTTAPRIRISRSEGGSAKCIQEPGLS
jgi:hypothetical protein